MARTRRRQHGAGLFSKKPTAPAAPVVPAPGSTSVMNPIPPTPPAPVSDSDLIFNELYTSLSLKFTSPRDYSYNPKAKKAAAPLPSEAFLQWELELQQCAILSRLAYSASAVLLNCLRDAILKRPYKEADKMITFTELGYYTKNGSGVVPFEDAFVNTGLGAGVVPPEATFKCGQFFPKTGCTMVLYQDNDTVKAPINPKPTLYVIFKGSSSFKDFVSDAKFAPMPLANIPGVPQNVNGQVHIGFYRHMEAELEEMVVAVQTLSAKIPQGRIVVCGHSLGGAMATLFSFILCKRNVGVAGAPIECFTYGAPTLFTDEGRNSFNECLLSRQLLLNRVWATKDGITVIPPGLSHPGFKPLKTEGTFGLLSSSSSVTDKTGRSVDIGDMRRIFASDQIFTNKNSTYANATVGFTEQNKIDAESKQIEKFLYTEPLPMGTYTAEQQAILAQANAQVAKNSPPEGTAMEGGALGFTKAGRDYKTQTLKIYPTSIHYKCFRPGCHGGYGGIGFMGALRLPNPLNPKKEPKFYTDFYTIKSPILPAKGQQVYIKIIKHVKGEPIPAPAPSTAPTIGLPGAPFAPGFIRDIVYQTAPATGAGRRRSRRRKVAKKHSHKKRRA